ncbi:MAG: DHH family phosphoesterase [Bacteroidota bacterium]
MSPIQAIEQLLVHPKKIVLVIHQSPDGDALGSGIAMMKFLQEQGHEVTLISPDSPPPFLEWLPRIKEMLCFDQEGDRLEAKEALRGAALIFCLDFPVLHRAGEVASLIALSKAPKVALDHHPDHENFAEVMWVDTKACATAILVYRMIVSLRKEETIDTQMATCLYVGIMTDTGSFQYSNTNAEAQLVAGALIERGADLAAIRRHISPKKPLKKVRFFAHMFLKRLNVMPKYQAAYLKLSYDDYLKFKLRSGDTEGLASELLEIEGISLAVLMVEKEAKRSAGQDKPPSSSLPSGQNAGKPVKTHLSFRSSGKIPVNYLSQKYFSGGGHPNAAGGVCFASLAETEQQLREIIKKEMPELI